MLIFKIPDLNKLHDFLLGLVSPKEHAEISIYLDSKPDILRELAESLGKDDGLIIAIRKANLNIFQEVELSKGIHDTLETNVNETQWSEHFQGEFGDYILGRCIAPKKYFSVFQAWDKIKNSTVAIKISNTNNPLNFTEVEIQNEIRVLSKIKHQNIINIFDHGIINKYSFFSMEWLDGSDLGLLLDRTGRLPLSESCEIVRQVCVGLDVIWKNKIVHRDIKPSNVFLTTKGVIKILDFGSSFNQVNIKGLLESSSPPDLLVGTLDYMAPEQVLNSDIIDIRADIYSLGCMFFKLLTGKAPFALPEYRPVIRKLIAHTQLPFPDLELILPDCPSGIRNVLKKMTVKNPADRFNFPLEIAEKLKLYCVGADLKMFFSTNSPFIPLSVLDFSKTKKKSNTIPKIGFVISACILLISMVALYFFTSFFNNTSSQIEAVKIDLNQLYFFDSNQHGEFAIISFQKIFRGHLWKSILSKDQRYMYFALNDGTVRKWDLLENKQIWISGKLRIGKDEPCHSLFLSANEEILLCGGNQNWVECLSSLDGRKIWFNFNHSQKIWCSGISPDGIHGLTTGEDGIICFYDMKTGREIQFPRNEHHPMFSGGFAGNSTVFYSSSNELKLWNINGPVLLDKAQNPQGLGLLFSFYLKQGIDEFIYSATDEGSVFCHQVVNNSLVEIFCWHNELKEMSLSGISVFRDPILGVEKIVLMKKPTEGNKTCHDINNFLILIRKNGVFELKEMIGHTQRVTSGQFTEDGRIAITTSLDSTCRFWYVND